MMSRTLLDPDPEKQPAAGRHQVIVHVDADVLASDTAAGAAHLEGGPALSAPDVARIACDASVVVMLRRGQEVLDVGRATRSIPRPSTERCGLATAGAASLAAKENRLGYVQGHLVLLCGYHHRLISQ